MAQRWTTPNIKHNKPAPFKIVGRPLISGDPWILFVGTDQKAVELAAHNELQAKPNILEPPTDISFAVSSHSLPCPNLTGSRTLYLPLLDTAVNPSLGCLGSPLFLIAKFVSLTKEQGPLSIIATAIDPVPELLAQQGLFSHFEIRRVTSNQSVQTKRQTITASNDSALGKVIQALHLIQEGNLLEAIDTFRISISQDATLAAAHYELGKALLRLDDTSNAAEAFRQTTELLPLFSPAWANLGAALGESRNFVDAEKALSKAISLDPFSCALHSNLGVTYREQEKFDEAERMLEKSLALAPDFVFGHYNLASVYFLRGNYGKAVKQFEKARALDTIGSPRQSLMLAASRIGSGDVYGGLKDYRQIIGHLNGEKRQPLTAIAMQDLKQLGNHLGLSPELKEAVALIRTLAVKD